MNNKQKLEQTVTRVTEIRKKYERKMITQMFAVENASKREYFNRKRVAVRGLDFQKMKPFLAFCSTQYGIYAPMKLNRKQRVRAIPICFCVTLYEQELQTEFPKDDIRIPFELRGFWKMQQAVQFMEDFVKFQNKSQEVLLWEHRRLKNQGKAKAGKYFKILEEFVSMGTLSCAWKKEITYHDMSFVMKTDNTKLDVVPLCKILTKYYANVVTRINHYMEANASNAEEQKLEDIKEDFTKLMERYFVYIP